MMIRTSLKIQRGLLLLAVLSLGGCVSVPEQFQGDFPALTPGSVAGADLGTRVRWGGMVLDGQPDEAQTCFEILSRPLSTSMRPVNTDQTQGRFIACRPGFLDPEVFARGREVTLTGTIQRLDVRKVGEFDYQYPVVAAEFITLWPERLDVIIHEYDMFYRPWYWPYPYYHYPYPYPPHRAYPRARDKGPRIDIPAGNVDGSQGGL